MDYYSAVCVTCDTRWGVGNGYLSVSMCQPCLFAHSKKKKKRDYSGFCEAEDLVYNKMRLRIVPKKEKSTLEYLRARK